MDLLVLDGAAVAANFPMARAIELMAEAFVAVTSGTATLPGRGVLRARSGNAFATMPAMVEPDGAAPAFAVKAMTVVPANPRRGRPAHHGVVVVFDPETGAPASIVDAAAVTAIRTAAASAVATRLLARPEATVLALLGAGVQARSHLEAMALVRPLSEVRLWARDPARARALGGWARTRFGIETTVHDRVGDAVEGADIVCTTTASPVPVLLDTAVGDGTHINAVGASFANTRELDGELVRRSHVFVDHREAALSEAGDLLIPIREGAFSAGDIRAEIGELLLGRLPGRTSEKETTVFVSVGLAVQDLLSAHHVWLSARSAGAGVSVAWVGDMVADSRIVHKGSEDAGQRNSAATGATAE